MSISRLVTQSDDWRGKEKLRIKPILLNIRLSVTEKWQKEATVMLGYICLTSDAALLCSGPQMPSDCSHWVNLPFIEPKQTQGERGPV